MTNVTCTAEYCNYWAEGNLCSADKIVVKNTEGGREASTIDETKCETFELRRDDDAPTSKASSHFETTPEVAVGCTVDSCEYWGRGDRCVANHIDIFGMDVKHEEGTACETFDV
ncbi:DUF1540 domain-containing protein [Aneurinibacillus sp. REN35]|uniref:DUF1540 domain-containing protein n=1 Tax=Aneurinibacillus sp. REN35 TaxID=3237286 RepID=UPI00352719F6